MSTDSSEQSRVDARPSPDRDADTSASEQEESGPEVPADLMVVSRARRSNAGNRMSTLLAKSAEEEQWGDDWEEAPNEEEFVGDEANEQDDYNLDSSSSEEDEQADDDDAGEKELRKAERQEQRKRRKVATNPFAARLASARKRVKLDVPDDSSATPVPRPKKKSERASWIPTDEDGPVRSSSRTQTIANKETTLAKLKEKDRRRDDTLAMMKAAEARKAKDEPRSLSQAERLAEAARVERVNSKSLHRWEEAEEQRAIERQAKLDELKNRQIAGPFVRYYSGPAIYVDDRLKYSGKAAPRIEDLEEELNKDVVSAPQVNAESEVVEPMEGVNVDHAQPDASLADRPQTTIGASASPALEQNPQLQNSHTPTSQSLGQDPFMGSHGIAQQSGTMFAPSQDSNPLLFGLEQYAHTNQQDHSQDPSQDSSQQHTSELPPNPFSQSALPPFTATSHPHPPPNDPTLQTYPEHPTQTEQNQKPPIPPALPRRKTVVRALRNLLIMSSFPNLDAPPTSARSSRVLSSKEKDKTALIQFSIALFGWSQTEATSFVNTMLSAPKRITKAQEAAQRPKKELCAVTNAPARYRDPETGIAYRDARAYGVLRGVVGGGFVWSGELGCYVGGRATPMEGQKKGFLGMRPASGVPKRFLEMARRPSQQTETADKRSPVGAGGKPNVSAPDESARAKMSATSAEAGSAAALHPETVSKEDGSQDCIAVGAPT